MRPSSFGRYLLIFFLVAFLLIFGVIKIFGGHNAPKKPTTSGPVVKPLPDYANTFAQVSFTQDGRINGDDQHRAIKITIDQFQRRLDILKGYNGNILEEHNFKNNQTAYDIFLRAINNEGFLGKLKNATVNDERGQCPLGQRFIFELNDSGDVLSHLWSSSCGTQVGNFGGNTAALQELFQEQITDYDTLISKANVVL